ncbi:PAS fold-containing protein [Blastococcus aggregatus]|uniref:PAS fold-containing protein n=1 Tax=Blastococcus aggregatus TaxID=38502 RepID=A0A285V8A2_9ACTN|nr:SpoIIE family protein phosphatase [Blastococcus aggregatus]SOC50177.1 PAS fold-containing protein [Blastococcus aggregatus]
MGIPEPPEDPAGPRAALELLPTGLAIVDRELRVMLANRALRAVVGVGGGAPADPVGRLLGDVLPGAEPVVAACREVLADGRPVAGRLVPGGGAPRRGASTCLRIDVSPGVAVGGRPETLVVAIEDVTEYRRALDAAASLEALTEELSGALSLDDVLRVALDRAAAAVGAAACSVGLVEPGRDVLRVITVGFPGEVVGAFAELPADAALPGPAVVRDGRARYFADRRAAVEQFPQAAAILAGTAFEAAAVQPLLLDGERLGYLAVHFTDRGQLGPVDRELLAAVARGCAAAAHRARRGDEQRAERDLARRLQFLAGALAVASTADEVAAILTEQTPAVLGATVAIVGIYDPETRSFRMAVPTSTVPGRTRAQFEHWPLDAPLPSRDVFATGRPVVFGSLAERDRLYPALVGVEVAEQAWVQLPLQVQGRLLGTVSFGWPDPRRFAAEEIMRAHTIAELCSGALERARLADGQRQISEVLQRSLLPRRLPDVPGWQLAARYQPAGEAVRAGGDWFDAFGLPGGRLGLLIGDVAGHGVTAAGLMGQVRALARALARSGSPPGAVLESLSTAVHDLGAGAGADGDDDGVFVTCCYVQVDAARARLSVASAGHLAPLMRMPPVGDRPGRVRAVDLRVGFPLGVRRSAAYAECESPLLPGSTVLLFTDGLVERHDRLLDDGLAELADRFSAAPSGVDALCDDLMAAVQAGGEVSDDVALLAASPGGSPRTMACA